MRVSINPVTVDGITCVGADVSIAISSSCAIRLVPVGPNGEEFADAAMGIIGADNEPDMATFMATVAQAVTTLATSRGI